MTPFKLRTRADSVHLTLALLPLQHTLIARSTSHVACLLELIPRIQQLQASSGTRRCHFLRFGTILMLLFVLTPAFALI
ncbi:hypothetical protein PM082_022036 [Marasmius tenuissimus]|nr:hypothetical protein PM082_022036 [Marasmius tenuissimus]